VLFIITISHLSTLFKHYSSVGHSGEWSTATNHIPNIRIVRYQVDRIELCRKKYRRRKINVLSLYLHQSAYRSYDCENKNRWCFKKVEGK
jgi:hypothetical protein